MATKDDIDYAESKKIKYNSNTNVEEFLKLLDIIDILKYKSVNYEGRKTKQNKGCRSKTKQMKERISRKKVKKTFK